MQLHTSNTVTLDGRYIGRIDWKRCKGRYERNACPKCLSNNLSSPVEPYRKCNDCDCFLPEVNTAFIFITDFFNIKRAEFTFQIPEPIYVGKASNWKINPRLETLVRQIVENDINVICKYIVTDKYAGATA